MTHRRPLSDDVADERIRAWLDDKPVSAPRAFIQATMAPIPVMGQRRRSVVAIGRMRLTIATLARLATAAVVVVAVIGAFGVVRPPSGPGADPSPTPSGSPSPVPLPSGIALTNGGPLGAGTAAEPSVAGTYQSRLFRPVLRFTVPAGWSGGAFVRTFVGGSESGIGLPLSTGRGGIVITVPTSVEPPAPGDIGAAVPDDLFAWILANPNLELGASRDVTIGGIAGRAIEGTLSASAVIDPQEDAYRLVDYLPLLARLTFRLAVIVVDGQQLIIATIANTSDYPAFVVEADAVIETIVFPAR